MGKGYKWGGGALISGRACNRMYFLFTSRWDYNWGGLVSGGERGLISERLVIRCIFLFTGRWANKWGVGVGRSAYKRPFTVVPVIYSSLVASFPVRLTVSDDHLACDSEQKNPIR